MGYLHVVGVNTYLVAKAMRGSKKFCQRGSNFDNVFFLFVLFCLVNSNASISGPSSTCQFWFGSFVIFQWIRTSIAKKSYFCNCSIPPPPPTSGSVHACIRFENCFLISQPNPVMSPRLYETVLLSTQNKC